MDPFEIVVTIAGALAMFTLTSFHNRLKGVEQQQAKAPEKYVAKDDYRADMTYVKERLDTLVDLVSRKKDKHE